MSILYDNDFSSFTVGDVPPYGDLENVSVVQPRIAATIPGIYGDANYVTMPSLQALIYPHINPSTSFPAYTAFTLFAGMRQGQTGVDQEGTILTVNSNLNPFAGATLLTVNINSDGTFSAISANGGERAVSDFSTYQEKWWMFQISCQFSAFAGTLLCTVKIGINGVTIINSALLSNLAVAGIPATYWNNLILGGSAGGSQMGRLTIYDEIIDIGVNPHPGTPEARVSQGVIELIRLPGTGPTPVGGCHIYEA